MAPFFHLEFQCTSLSCLPFLCSSAIAMADLATLLQPFAERATLAEERLAKLEAAVRNPQGSAGQDGLLESLVELREKLALAKAEQDAERQKLSGEIKKLQYQVVHLRRAVHEADAKLTENAA